MATVSTKAFFGLLALATLLISCSENQPTNVLPPTTPLRGHVTVTNESDVRIELTDYYHRRGSVEEDSHVAYRLSPGYSLTLRNLIDDNGGTLFEGGDIVRVKYLALEEDPENPGQPLFQNSVELTVNGSWVIQVKNGGEFGISPG
jgi:hypothetical protein